ncbi:pantetheine-phosphate adenylyltransferase [Erysipelotrichaceae bacterium OttesenSCG-928-M19]|nr:pantetheine-phosphate adenylyltransferase [Erysipelotrichaceae bacterium OttesenSCG-928-M19]
MKIALYPGSFDPITNGHFDIIMRASKLFDKVYVTVLDNPLKKTLFSVKERTELIKEVVKGIDNIEVTSSSNLTVDYAKEINAKFIVRGLRATSDFEYELNIFATNNHLDASIDTVFLMTRLENSFISSSGIKEMVYYNATVKGLVADVVEQALIEKYRYIKDDEHCI